MDNSQIGKGVVPGMLTFGAKCLLMLVSVIIPCYNVEAYVARALDSALAQTHRPLEIIAVDNNSTDGTLAILRQYEQRYPELITVLQEPKQGAPAARNLGLRHAKGEWLQFLDADDVILPGKVGGQVGLVEDSNYSLVFGAYEHVDKAGKGVIRTPMDEPWLALMSGRAGITSANLWNAKAVREAGGWDEGWKSCQEPRLILEILKINANIVVSQELNTIVQDRKEGGQISNQSDSILVTNNLRMRLLLLTYLSQKGMLTDGSDPYYQVCFRFLRMYAGLYPEKARGIYDEYFPSDFRLSPNSNLGYGHLYSMIFNTLGFASTERLKRKIAKQTGSGRLRALTRRLIHGYIAD